MFAPLLYDEGMTPASVFLFFFCKRVEKWARYNKESQGAKGQLTSPPPGNQRQNVFLIKISIFMQIWYLDSLVSWHYTFSWWYFYFSRSQEF